MAYRVEVDYAPAYELVVSLAAYVKRPEHKILELGAGWVRRVREGLSPELAADLAAYVADRVPLVPGILIWQCPGERDVAGFLRWLAGLSPGELYERLAPYVPGSSLPRPPELGGLRDRAVRLLATWDEQYFRGVDPAIAAGLAADAAAKRALVETLAPQEAVEAVTGGIWLEPPPGLERVVLVPQYHCRPLNAYDIIASVAMYLYPADVLPPAPGQPSPGLRRLVRALGDESRLRILRFLAGGPRSFAEVVRFAGLAKSTVHHHLVALRAAGLVRVHVLGDGSARYSLRPGALDAMRSRLGTYLEGE